MNHKQESLLDNAQTDVKVTFRLTTDEAEDLIFSLLKVIGTSRETLLKMKYMEDAPHLAKSLLFGEVQRLKNENAHLRKLNKKLSSSIDTLSQQTFVFLPQQQSHALSCAACGESIDHQETSVYNSQRGGYLHLSCSDLKGKF